MRISEFIETIRESSGAGNHNRKRDSGRAQRRWGLGFLYVLAGLSLLSAACQKNVVSSLNKQNDAFRVAILLPGRIDDGQWSQAAYEGLQLVSGKLHIPFAYKANLENDNKEEAIRAFAAEGYNFVIGHGRQFIEAMERIAQDYPQTDFAVTTAYEGNNQNLGGISFRVDELGYISGVVAALKSQTGRIGFIGGVSYPHMLEKVDFFKKGARSINPFINIEVKWLGSWYDKQRAAAISLETIKHDIDVIMANADEANTAVHETAQAHNIWTIGYINDVYTVAPRSVITSCVLNTSRLLLEGVLLSMKGQWEGKQYTFGFKEGAQQLAPFRDSLSKEKQDLVDKLIEQIIMGELELFRS